MAALTLRVMEPEDLDQVSVWLARPHVARWYLAGSTLEQEVEELRQSIAGVLPVHALVVMEDGVSIGWCQWYRCDDDPDWAADVGAAPGDVGLDFAIGEPTCTARGLGTVLVRTLVRWVAAARGDAAFVSDPDARNHASRRVLEKNGFGLVRVAALASESTDDPMAVYRLPAGAALTRPGPPEEPGGPGSN